MKRRSKDRNDKLFDLWSLTHIAWGILLGWLMAPLLAITLLALWEPIETRVLSPLFHRYGIEFGFESIRNSLSDIFFGVIGVIIGVYVIGHYITPPFHFF